MARHPDTDLVPYLRGELPPAERERVARHLEECPDCKQDTELLRDLLGNLAYAIGEPPEISWPRYRAELRAKLEARRALVPWWRRPMPLALSASLAGALLFVAVWGGRELTKRPDAIGPEEVAIGSELGLLQEIRTVERLDLLEDFEVITNLDRLASERQG
ncbi:MAG TPA: zf-HC2 domain-containing protein [Methylomirabilota bacterium]|nr:zf-HC2 domain-containing protein [Methylomirabilota bacterium]